MATPILNKGLGRIKDVADERDSVLPSAHLLSLGAPIPPSCDVFSSKYMPVFDQGTLGSCTANAGCLYREYLAAMWPEYSKGPYQTLSRLFLYYQERKANGDIGTDSGAQIRDICKTLVKTGVCPESDDPYDIALFTDASVNDSVAANAAAVAYKAGAYHRTSDVATAKTVLLSKYPLLLGFTVYESFESIGKDGIMPMPDAAKEQVLGGHAVVIRGYDENKQSLLIQNSWGADWGFLGSFWMPYAFLNDTDLSQTDMWVVHLGPPWVPQQKAS